MLIIFIINMIPLLYILFIHNYYKIMISIILTFLYVHN